MDANSPKPVNKKYLNIKPRLYLPVNLPEVKLFDKNNDY